MSGWCASVIASRLVTGIVNDEMHNRSDCLYRLCISSKNDRPAETMPLFVPMYMHITFGSSACALREQRERVAESKRQRESDRPAEFAAIQFTTVGTTLSPFFAAISCNFTLRSVSDGRLVVASSLWLSLLIKV